MKPSERLRRVAWFSGLGDNDIDRLAASATEVKLEDGEWLFAEGDEGRTAYVIDDGELEVVKEAESRDILLAVRGADSVIGEMALLREEPRMAGVRARGDTTLLAIDKAEFDRLLASSAAASRSMFETLLARLEENQELLRHSERMAQLGTLVAGVAHELNNPAAAVKRAAESLQSELTAHIGRLAALDDEALDIFTNAAAIEPSPMDPLQRNDIESNLESRLAGLGVAEPWQIASDLVEGGVTSQFIDETRARIGDAGMPALVSVLASQLRLTRLGSEVSMAASRISGIVKALKGYSFLDQAPVQDVDVVSGIEDTLLLLAHKLKGVNVVKEYYPNLPKITAFGSELNQVWTNLIDNAADAVGEGGTLIIRTLPKPDGIAVEIEDDGPGIPADIQHQVFDAFFTTKAPGHGTGLGLRISYQIVVLQHRGSITLDSEPGHTVFRVELPLAQK